MLKIKFFVQLKMTVALLNANRKKDCMLQNLWITEKTSGICIFEKNIDEHGRIKFSNNLICGFFSAVSMLGLEVFAENISCIIFSNSKIIFKNTKNFLFIFRFQNKYDFNSYKIKNLINEISKTFADTYDNTLQNWNRDVCHFKNFSNLIESKLY